MTANNIGNAIFGVSIFTHTRTQYIATDTDTVLGQVVQKKTQEWRLQHQIDRIVRDTNVRRMLVDPIRGAD